MKVKVKGIEVKKDANFPCLMVSGSGTIIIAIGVAEGLINGIVLKDTEPLKKKMGHQSNTYNSSCFKPFNGTITLQND